MPPARPDVRAGPPSTDEVHLWWFATDSPIGGRDRAMLSDGEREAARRYRRAEDARRFEARRVARRRILAAYTGTDPETLVFDTRCRHCGAGHGKPRLAAPHDAIRFNASHAGGTGVVAVTGARDVGVDIEDPARVHDLGLMAEQVMTRTERARIEADRAPRTCFIESWAAKEAYAKLRGLGLAAPLDRLETTIWDPADAIPDPLGTGRFRVVGPLRPAGTGVVALAVDGAAPVTLRTRRWLTTVPSNG